MRPPVMNTLHLYHWRDIYTADHCFKLIGQHDNLVIYGAPTESDLKWLNKWFEGVKQNCYLVNQEKTPNTVRSANLNAINNEQWLNLIIAHKNTLAWK